jgi:multicomponent Na+:H+ antiporter subunit E
MVNHTRRLIYFVVGFIVWMIACWPFADGKIDWQVTIAGVVAAAIVAFLFHEILPKEHHVFMSPVRIFWFLVYVPVFIYYVILSNLDVVYRAVHPAMPIKPGIVKIKTNLKTDSAITALANSITLTPGTMTVDLTEDGFIYIHWINVQSTDVETATQQISQNFEWFIKRIFE